jgi:hypothetical protein
MNDEELASVEHDDELQPHRCHRCLDWANKPRVLHATITLCNGGRALWPSLRYCSANSTVSWLCLRRAAEEQRDASRDARSTRRGHVAVGTLDAP